MTGFAYPQTEQSMRDGEYGLTKREAYAMAAITGKADHQGHHPNLIKDAWAIAGAMIAEGERS